MQNFTTGLCIARFFGAASLPGLGRDKEVRLARHEDPETVLPLSPNSYALIGNPSRPGTKGALRLTALEQSGVGVAIIARLALALELAARCTK
jgi:hypothetical protein